MTLAKVSTNGQITIPSEVRRVMDIKTGDKIMFTQNNKGEIIVQNLCEQKFIKVKPPVKIS